jgi:Matrixin
MGRSRAWISGWGCNLGNRCKRPIHLPAFADWATYANIQFQQVASTTAAQIDFSLGTIDGIDNTLGETNYLFSGSQFTSAAVEFDSGEGWHVAGNKIVSNHGVNLFVLALHEIGHAIGLNHYNAAPAIMNAVLDPAVTDLRQSDIDGVEAIYGPSSLPGNDKFSFNFKLTDATVSFSGNHVIVDGPSGSHTVLTGVDTFVFTDGIVNENDGDPLVDDLFYYSHNHDVWNAHVDADQHYHQFGWHEGRDPDALFDTNGYLAANPDVANAHVDPLVHYHQFGWREGRDPSPAFDTTEYLSHNPDVAAAHIDPLMHYLQFGVHEGRQTFSHAILGSTGNDILKGTTGSESFSGQGGQDTFVFAANFGHDVIRDFGAVGPSHDVLQFSKSVFDSFASVLSHASQAGQDVVISANSDTLLLKNTKLGDLDSHDFRFA